MNHIPRRRVVTGLAGLSLASLLADPVKLARAAASLSDITITTAGGRQVSGALGIPATTPAPTVLLVHEWWGLNPQIRGVAAELSNLGFVTLAVDLYGGKVATDPDTARSLAGAVMPAEAIDTLSSWIDALRKRPDANGKLATIGWCFGGGWSLRASLARPVDATVIYYGDVTPSEDALKALQGPVLGHFGNLDKFITPDSVNTFEARLKHLGKKATIYRYDANHAFANPTGQNYQAADARLAWDRTVAFLKATIGG
ncbi:MAG TPA: dienelactone hydrolase family protein [Dongiaceae bacterium]